MAFAWIRILGNAGYVNAFLQKLLGWNSPPFKIYGLGGVIFVSVIYTYPYAFIVLSKSMENIGAHLEEAALVSGARKHHILRDIVLPVLLPSVGSSAVIVFVTTISMFGIPALLGTPGHFIVITTRIYGYVGGFRDPNGIGIATALSLVLLVLAGSALGLQSFLTRRDHFSTITGKSAPLEPTCLGTKRVPATIFLSLFVLLIVAGPLIAIGATSLTRALGLPLNLKNITGEHFHSLLGMGLVRRSFRNSLGLAIIVPTLSTAGSIILVYLRRKKGIFGHQIIDHVVSIPYAVPGIVIGVAMILTGIHPVFGVSIYNTIWILGVAYMARFMIFPMRTIEATWKQIDPSLEEAACVSGQKARGVLKEISIPLLKTGIGSGWLLAFMPALTELTLSILLYSPGNETIGVIAFNIMEEGLIPLAAAYAMAIVVLVLCVHALTQLFSRKDKYLRSIQNG
jgi:iron(III) transport system permease protein